jgi:thiol:disulfide interchange protein
MRLPARPSSRSVALALTLLLTCATTACAFYASGGRRAKDSRTASKGERADKTTPQKDVSALWRSGAEGYEAARREQQEANAPLVVYFYTDWCPYCDQFNERVLQTSEVQNALAPFAKVRINPEDGPKEEAISEQFGVSGYPSFFVVPAGTQSPIKLSRSKSVGGEWVERTPGEFAQLCRSYASGG